MATRLGSGAERREEGRRNTAAEREQTENRQTDRKKEYIIFKGEKREKTPLRLAKACKCVYIHITQYRGVVAVYCTFFYIL